MARDSQTRNFKVISITVDLELFARVNQLASRHGVSVSSLTCHALERLLERRDNHAMALLIKRVGLRRRRVSK
jgi:predicted transcriptional regulator